MNHVIAYRCVRLTPQNLLDEEKGSDGRVVSWALLMLLWSTAVSDSALKNHRAEKRQDGSFLFFGGWRPLKPRNAYYHGAASTRFHDILSALPHNYDAAANYYTHALPTQYHKDIYSYYPRPAIKSTPKKNTPVYMERLRPLKQQQKQSVRGMSHGGPQFIDLPNLDFKQLKELHEAIIHTKELPITPLNLPIESVKPLEIVQVSLQSLQPGIQNYAFGNSNGYGRTRSGPRGRKSGHRRIPQSHRPSIQSPVEYKYIAVPKPAQVVPQIHTKEIEITPIKLPQHGVSVEELVDVKNVQIIEVPQILSYGGQNGKSSSKSQYSGKSSTRSNQQYKSSAQSSPQKGSAVFSYYAHQTEQPRKHYPPPQVKSNPAQHQPQIEAELVKLSEDDLKHLLSNLQVLDKGHQDILKYVPLNNIGHSKDENIQLVVSLPEGGHGQGGNSKYESQGGYSNDQYESNKQYAAEPQQSGYPSKESGGYGQNSGNYQTIEHNSVQYQIEEPRSNGGHYEQGNYQTVEQQSGYDHQQGYQNNVQYESKGNYQEGGQQYSKSNGESSREQSGGYGEREPSYIQVIAPQADENGYRREPVLAIEIQHGQTIEEAIKALDRETLAKLGTHGKNGIEIEVVEVPIDDYVSESKKTETFVSPKNTTVIIRAKKTTEEKS
ncbi:hypothetical protein AVEN_204854-1 [Araneus ventricosus]|uniref:Uncharacterized protein n=1 Tax=Araneus ventricosus TaxID=182803 RepID=A0A4Y2PXR0_ARAVE|nr:hypothetical protein AVEN_204854-1 [Araneus ventricosus]